MSSSTQTPQQLYEAEKVRTKVLDKKIARFEAERENDRAERENDRLKKEADIERIDSLEVELELKDEELQAKDATIQELQTAFDEADRPRTHGDGKNFEELRARIRSLEGQIMDLDQKIKHAVRGDWDKVKPYLDEVLQSDMDAADERLKACQTDLSNAKTELASSKEELGELREFNQVLLRELDCLLVEADNQAEIQASRSREFISLAQQVKETNHALISLAEQEENETEFPSKLANASRLIRMRLGAVIDRAKPFTLGLKQGVLKELAASSNRFAALADDERRTTKSAAQAKNSTDHRQPSPSRPIANENAEKRDQRADSARPVPQEFKYSRAVKLPAGMRTQRPSSKSAPPTEKEVFPNFPLNPAAPSSAPKSSRTMAQVAIDPPPMLEKPAGVSFIESFLNGTFTDSGESSDSEEPREKSKISDRKKMQDAAAGNVVEPGKRKPRVPEPKPAPQVIETGKPKAMGPKTESRPAPRVIELGKPKAMGPKTESRPAPRVIELGFPKAMGPKTESRPAPRAIELGYPKTESRPAPRAIELGYPKTESRPAPRAIELGYPKTESRPAPRAIELGYPKTESRPAPRAIELGYPKTESRPAPRAIELGYPKTESRPAPRAIELGYPKTESRPAPRAIELGYPKAMGPRQADLVQSGSCLSTGAPID